jgi:hypothetical protein
MAPGELGSAPGVPPLVEVYFVSKYNPGALFTLASPSSSQFESPLLKICLYRIGLFVSISKKYSHTHHVNSIPVLRLFDLKMGTLLLFVGSWVIVTSLVPAEVPFIKNGVDLGCIKYPISNIPKLAKNKNTIRTKIMNANFATMEFEFKKSLDPFTDALEPNSLKESFTVDAAPDTPSEADLNAFDAEFDIFFKKSGISDVLFVFTWGS